MKTYLKHYIRNFDYSLFIVYLGLCLFGLVMIYSSSMVWAVNHYKHLNYPADHFYQRQLTNLKLAIPMFFIASFIPYKHYRKKKIMLISVLTMLTLLILVHFIGFGENVGAKSWISLPFGNIQPSEVAKLLIIIYFAGVFANKYQAGTLDNINKSIAPPMLILLFAVGLIMNETDIGATIILIMTAVCVMAASGIRFKTFLKLSGIVSVLLAIGGVFLYFAWEEIMTGGRIGRLLSYRDPFEYMQSSGLQVVNGYIAIGAGGLKGLGLGNSIQKMGYLPEPHTDFIMAIISEETGLIGTSIVIGGLGFIVLRALTIALKTKDFHGRMLAAGIGGMIGIQTFVNLGGLTGLIPLTGVTLPFISYGGTSIILLSLALGILMNVSMFTKYEKNK